MTTDKLTKADVFNAIVRYGEVNEWETDYDHALCAAQDIVLDGRITSVEQLEYGKIDLLYNIYYV